MEILKDLRWYYWALVCAIPSIILFIVYFKKWFCLQWRFGKNLKRKVYFLKTSESINLQTQKDQIINLKLFNVEKDIKDDICIAKAKCKVII